MVPSKTCKTRCTRRNLSLPPKRPSPRVTVFKLLPVYPSVLKIEARVWTPLTCAPSRPCVDPPPTRAPSRSLCGPPRRVLPPVRVDPPHVCSLPSPAGGSSCRLSSLPRFPDFSLKACPHSFYRCPHCHFWPRGSPLCGWTAVQSGPAAGLGAVSSPALADSAATNGRSRRGHCSRCKPSGISQVQWNKF